MNFYCYCYIVQQKKKTFVYHHHRPRSHRWRDPAVSRHNAAPPRIICAPPNTNLRVPPTHRHRPSSERRTMCLRTKRPSHHSSARYCSSTGHHRTGRGPQYALPRCRTPPRSSTHRPRRSAAQMQPAPERSRKCRTCEVCSCVTIPTRRANRHRSRISARCCCTQCSMSCGHANSSSSHNINTSSRPVSR